MSALNEAKTLLRKAVEDLTQLMESMSRLPENPDGTYTIKPAVLIRHYVQIADALSETIDILNQYRQK